MAHNSAYAIVEAWAQQEEHPTKNTMNDLDLASVLRKTAAGIDAIKLRERAVTPKMRMLLIMVDGVKTGAEVLKLVPNADEARQLLLIKGAIPGSAGGFVTVRPAVKAKSDTAKGAN